MAVKYNIEMPGEYSAALWKLLTDNLNVILTKSQHSLEGKTLHIELRIRP